MKLKIKTPIRVAVTGAAGQIGYSLLFRIASGAMFGPEQPVILHLIEIEPAIPVLNGVVMELQDCTFPLLKDIIATADLNAGFKDVNWALLVGASPRRTGMQRSDLLGRNGGIFASQGKAIAASAASDVRIVVVGNPCNTNCLIAMNHAKSVPADRWFAMTMLEQSRGVAQLAAKAGVDVTEISNLAVWGNHSATMYPDYFNAKIGGKLATEVIKDEVWFKETFIPEVQERGTAILKARGFTSAASAANAVVDTVRNLINPTPAGDCFSVGVCSDGSYGIEKGLVYSFPVVSDGVNWKIVQGVDVNEFSRAQLILTENELKEEKAVVAGML